MATLSLRYEDCVRTRATAATCHACRDTCPTDAIRLDGPRASVVVELARCIDCGLCQAACPTAAFESAFDAAAFVASAPSTVRCGADIPCVAALGAEDLATLAVRHQGLRLEADAACHAGARAHDQLPARLAQVHAFLAALGIAARITFDALPSDEVAAASSPLPSSPAASSTAPAPASPGRRDFLRRLLPRVEAEAPAVPEAPATLTLDPARLSRDRLRSTRVPLRRSRLLAVLGQPTETGSCAVGDLGFVSSKHLDPATCTACMMCVNVCPTGALTTSRLHDEIRFSTAACVKCHLCHDVCEPHALTLAPDVRLAEMVAGSPAILTRLTIKRCTECGTLYKYEGGSALCPRCRDLDDEARDLVGF